MRRSEQSESPADPVPVERVGALSWRPVLVVTLIAGIVGVALAKPWDSLQPPPQTVARVAPTAAAVSEPSVEPTAAPTPTIDPAIDAASLIKVCNAPPGWRLISMETDVLGESRTMFALDAVVATGATDPIIPTAQLRASVLYGVGVCRPNPAARQDADLPFNSVTIWLVAPNGSATAVDDPTLLNVPLYRLGEAYYGPPRERWTDADNADPTQPSWRPGRYVVQISDAAPSGASLWIALDFLAA